ncbi:hypothetical protein QN277_014372 [Acacia crassicarpa]|uniref:F-box/kelch-repeat protein SKIP25 n=1 Tax=Acacia crassicarpa TaxID=499986 RepID=A0AAE1M491_9FABA|nr:hypothetical protein QN277_014372 [Acacia crassicarpa]
MANASSSPICPEEKKKKQRLQHNPQPLIPGLPEPVAQICLALVGDPFLLFSVCHSWRLLLYSPSFPPFLSLYAFLSSSTPTPLLSESIRLPSSSVQTFNFDPISSTWHSLPPPPPDPPLQLILRRHPSFLSRNLPIQSISVAGKLILLAGSTHDLRPALARPLIFDPISQNWSFGPNLTTPRRWCALGASRGFVYMASGIGTKFSSNVARSMEMWDFTRHPNNGGEWEKKKDLKHGRFSRDAIDAVGWRGKLCMVNVKGDVTGREGIVYDVEGDTWRGMPEGMLHGWRGPVGAMAEEVMYGVDEVTGVLRKYNEEEDTWEEIMESERLKGAEQVVAEGGRVCVVSGGGIFVVNVTAAPARIWEVELPAGLEAVAVHVLPRMPVVPYSSLKD